VPARGRNRLPRDALQGMQLQGFLVTPLGFCDALCFKSNGYRYESILLQCIKNIAPHPPLFPMLLNWAPWTWCGSPLASFLRKPESGPFRLLWTPAFAGVTAKASEICL